MRLSCKLTCPYCGHENNFSTSKSWYGHKLEYCDDESGGCSGIFVVEYKAHLTAEVRRVEGEEKN